MEKVPGIRPLPIMALLVVILITVVLMEFSAAEEGSLKWAFNVGDSVSGSPVIGSDGTIYIVSKDCHLWAINSNGSQKWKVGIGNGMCFHTPSIGIDGNVYVGSDYNTGKLYSVNSSGYIEWEFKRNPKNFGTPAIASDGTLLVSDSLLSLFSLDSNGDQKWVFQKTDGYGDYSFSPVIARDGTIYWIRHQGWFFDDRGRLFAIKWDGSVKWEYQTSFLWGALSIGGDGTMYVGSEGNRLHAINPNGTLKWSFQRGTYGTMRSPAVGSDGTIYIGSSDNYLYAVNPDGSLKWSFQTGGDVSNSAAAVDSNGTIYIGSSDTYLYAVNPNGSLRWSFRTGASLSTSAAIDNNGTIYVGSSDNYLYAIEGNSRGLANSSWPMLHRDLAHTGRAVSVDSDSDGLLDEIENATATNPYKADTDDDGILDGAEDANHNGIVDAGETNPRDADTDGDGCPDGVELKGARNPLLSDPFGDLNGDCALNLDDAILALRVTAGMASFEPFHQQGEVNGDARLGTEEIIYIFQKISGIR